MCALPSPGQTSFFGFGCRASHWLTVLRDKTLALVNRRLDFLALGPPPLAFLPAPSNGASTRLLGVLGCLGVNRRWAHALVMPPPSWQHLVDLALAEGDPVSSFSSGI